MKVIKVIFQTYTAIVCTYKICLNFRPLLQLIFISLNSTLNYVKSVKCKILKVQYNYTIKCFYLLNRISIKWKALTNNYEEWHSLSSWPIIPFTIILAIYQFYYSNLKFNNFNSTSTGSSNYDELQNISIFFFLEKTVTHNYIQFNIVKIWKKKFLEEITQPMLFLYI